MKCFSELGRKVIFKALTITMLLGAFMVFMGGWAYAAEKTVAEQILDIMLANHEISQAQYDALLKQAEAEKMAAVQKIAEAQKAAAAQQAVVAPVERKPTDFTASWKNGLRFTTDDKAFDIHIGGRIQADVADAEPNTILTNWANGKYKSGFSEPKSDGFGDQMRRVRLAIDGTVWSNIEFISQIDFAPSYSVTTGITKGTSTTSLTTGAAVTYADVWVGVKDIPYIGRIRVGQMYEPISLEQLTSDNWTTFMEKSLPVGGLVPNRNTGVVVQNTDCNDRMGWMVGYFFQQQAATSSNGVATDTTGDLFSPHLDATNVAARFTGLPWYEDNGAKLLHIGIGYEHKFRSGSDISTNPGTIDFKAAPEANMFNALFDSGNFMAKGVDVIDPEIALVYGPFSVQAEYMYAAANDVTDTSGKFLKGATTHDANFSGWYAYASYFITGEHRMYNKTTTPSDYQAAFGRIIPNCNFNPLHGGIGAWEVAFRVSNMDVDDINAGFNGGNETDYTFAVNWYLNPNVMVKMNYIYAHVNAHSDGYGDLLSNGNDNIFETRFQIAF